MTDIVSVWIAAAFDPAYLCGGWASVRRLGPEPAGHAGGERRTTALRMLLTGLAAGLRGAPPTAAVTVKTHAAEAAMLAGVLSGATPGPEGDLDLWAPVLAACRGRAVKVIAAPSGPDTPMAFARAWAELSRDKTKAKGPFTAAIPRANLIKVDWPRTD